MAILTQSGRVALTMAIANEVIHLAWGSGDPAWDSAPVVETVDSTALVNELGRHSVTQVSYCTPNPVGDIIISNGRFSSSASPTNHLFLRFNFDFNDASSAEIREFGIFTGTSFIPNIPPGQTYFLPAEIQSPGVLLAVERIPKITRSNSVRQSFEFVLTL